MDDTVAWRSGTDNGGRRYHHSRSPYKNTKICFSYDPENICICLVSSSHPMAILFLSQTWKPHSLSLSIIFFIWCLNSRKEEQFSHRTTNGRSRYMTWISVSPSIRVNKIEWIWKKRIDWEIANMNMFSNITVTNLLFIGLSLLIDSIYCLFLENMHTFDAAVQLKFRN